MLCDQIRALHRDRCFMMEQRKRNDLALGSYIRIVLGWSRNNDQKKNDAIKKEALRLMKKPSGELKPFILDVREANEPFVKKEKAAKKQMEKLAKELPVWKSFGKGVKGFGPIGLATLIGEAGDLSNYDDVAKLWKRMGLAVFDGVRQGGLGKGASADAWIEHGYNPKRRSVVFANIGDPLIKGNKDGYYRTLYLDRKAYEVARDPEIKPIVAHRRAQRYMEKRLLKHLWQAWRGAGAYVSERTVMGLPPAEIRPSA